ncbi:MAG: hypothetical protein ABSD74_10940 [Rhizomicrobium sp.]
MRRLAVLLCTMCLGGCTTVTYDRDPDGAGYTLTVPSDVFASRPMLWQYAAEKSGELCQFGWKLVSADNSSSDVKWKIRCLARPAGLPER